MDVKAYCGNVIFVENATTDMINWAYRYLTVRNPDYYKKLNMGKYVGNTPELIYLYERKGDDLILPFGVFRRFYRMFHSVCDFKPEFADFRHEKYQVGIELYPYQENALNKALDYKNGILVMPCGSGKTILGLNIIAKLGGRALWLTHTQDLLNQSMKSAKKILNCESKHPYGTITGGKSDIGTHITFATVQTMCKMDLSRYENYFDVIIVDECMPCNTLIDTPYGKKELKNLCIDDIISTYNRNTGQIENKRISYVFKNKAHDIVSVNLSNGEQIICTKNHPVYTMYRGRCDWIDAERLNEDDYVLRLVRKRSRNEYDVTHNKIQDVKARLLLLFKRMFNKRWTQKGYLDRGTKEKGFGENERNKRKVSRTVCRAYENKQSYEKSRYKKCCIKKIKRNWSSSKNQMWQWNGVDCTTTEFNDSTCESCRSICGISDTNKTRQKKWLSNLLQGRYCNTNRNDCNRSGWKFSYGNRTTEPRQKERCLFEWVRVESVTVHEQTSDGTFGGLCPDGYVYNIEVEDNNNYFANGILVHNCQHCCGSPTRVTQFYKVVSALSARYKIGLTATPKRADGLELGMFALLGDIIHEVTRKEVAEKTCDIKVHPIYTGYMPDENNILNPDGTIDYGKVIDDLIHDDDRYNVVFGDILIVAKSGATMILANRVEYLQRIHDDLIGCGVKSVMLSGQGQSKKAKQQRKEALEKLNDGEIDCILGTYILAKEGLDVPNLRYVVFATPEKDETTVIQSVGRVGRSACGKEYGTVIDFVDDFGMYIGWWKKRKGYYKKINAEVIE